MKTELVHLLFPLSVLFLGAAVEEMLPFVLSVGFPILMVSAILLGARRPFAEALLLVVAAGVIEDALCALPLATTASFLLMALFAVRVVEAPRAVAIAAYPVYQLWLAVWTTLPAGAVWGRLLVAVPVGALTVFLLHPALRAFERGVAADAR